MYNIKVTTKPVESKTILLDSNKIKLTDEEIEDDDSDNKYLIEYLNNYYLNGFEVDKIELRKE